MAVLVSRQTCMEAHFVRMNGFAGGQQETRLRPAMAHDPLRIHPAGPCCLSCRRCVLSEAFPSDLSLDLVALASQFSDLCFAVDSRIPPRNSSLITAAMVFCTYCGQSFTRDEHLERHILTRKSPRRGEKASN